jgi:protein-tyrosine-phosphatase
MASYLYRQLCPAAVVLSAGLDPGEHTSETALAMLACWGIDATRHHPTKLDRRRCDEASAIFVMAPPYVRRLLLEYGRDLEDATYQAAPFDEPLEGVEAIARFWEDEREGPDEVFTLASEIVATEGDTAVARLEVVYSYPPQRTYRDLWIIMLSTDGRCRHFEEWPFHPGEARTAF